jgi:phospholipase/carboxylesterase
MKLAESAVGSFIETEQKSMRTVSKIGDLVCTVIDDLPDGARPELIVVLCHGYGASGDDLTDIGARLLQASPRVAESTRFVFPHAPLSLDALGMPGGRAWWHLDVNRLVNAVEKREFGAIAKENPEGLPAAREMLLKLIESFDAEFGIDPSQIVLGGFSQGSMLTTDVALRLPTPPAGLCVWSGTLICEDTWRDLAKRRGSLRVLQSHGYYDPILPFDAAISLRDLFQENGFDVEFIEFPGMHEIRSKVLEQTLQMLKQLLGERD